MHNPKYMMARYAGILKQYRRASTLVLVAGVLTVGVSQARSEDDPKTVATDTAAVTPNDTVGKPNGSGSPSLVGTVNRPPRPLPVILGMVENQTEKLDRVYIEFASQRVEQERKIVDWQGDFQKAQSPASFDERKAAKVSKNIGAATQKITDAFLKARGRALEILSPAQRTQLQGLAQQATASPAQPGAPAPPARDEYYQLLLMPVEQLLGTPVDTQAVRRLAQQQADRDGDLSFSLGYGYGDTFGLFGRGYDSGFGFGFGFGSGHRHRRWHR